MKKNICKILACGLILGTSVTGVHAEEALLISPAPATYTVTVGGSALKLNGKAVFVSNKHIMVPLRSVAESLGFKVSWNGEKQGITLDDGEVNTTVYIGEDNYYMASSFAIGMSAPTALGAAPVLKDDTTYVPGEMFDILCGAGTFSVKDNEITFKKAGGKSENTQIPNPVVEYKTVEDAEKAIDFKAPTPEKLPKGYELNSVSVISNEIFQIFYKNGENEILYRSAKGSEDISGDYNKYETVKKLKTDSLEITAKGNGEKINSATWTNGSLCHSLYSSEGISEKELSEIIKNIK